jgi:hypothetical protein
MLSSMILRLRLLLLQKVIRPGRRSWERSGRAIKVSFAFVV